jgi:hypothetical protein
MCVGKEIEWQQLANKAVDQSWFSRLRLKEQSFSSLAYEFISYDLVLDGWLELAPEATEAELSFLEEDGPIIRALLNECEEAAVAQGNDEILPLVAKAREFIDAFEAALLYRYEEYGIDWPNNDQWDTSA